MFLRSGGVESDWSCGKGSSVGTLQVIKGGGGDSRLVGIRQVVIKRKYRIREQDKVDYA